MAISAPARGDSSLFSRLFVFEFSAEKCPWFIGAPIDGIRVISYGEKGWSAIPFQIDRRDKNGEYLFPGDPNSTRVNLESKDEFVIQGDDLGQEAPADELRKLKGVLEIKVTRGHRAAFAYIGYFSIAKSGKDYIRFDKATSGIITDYYVVGCHPTNHSFFSEIKMGGVDHLDRVKLRARASLFFGSLNIERTEKDISGRPVEVIDGPVRVLQRIEYKVRIIKGIHSPTLSRVTKSYRAVYLIPNRMRVPFSLDSIFTSLSSIAAFDFTPEISGARIYCAQCGQGFTVNGKMDSHEFSDTGVGSQSAALCSKYGAMIMSVKTTDKVDKLPFEAGGIYIDDRNDLDPPEDIPGKFGWFGYELKGLHKIPKGNYNFFMALLFPKECPGSDNIENFANQYWGEYSMETNYNK